MSREEQIVRGRPRAGRLITCVVMLCIATSAAASGWPPFAFTDSMTVFRGGSVDRLDSGAASVLDNDLDFERDRLTAVLAEAPKHGDLDLRADGTFVYVHNGNKKNDDEFRYRAFDGTGYSRSTRVRISIEDVPNAPPVVIGDVGDQEAIAGAAFVLNLAGNFSDPDPDDVLTFSAKGLPRSRSLAIDPVTGVLSGTPIENDIRSKPYDVEITARDLAGDSAKLKFDLLIREEDRPDASLDIVVVTNPVGVGETSRWELIVRNNGPGTLETGVLTTNWATSGPTLSLNAPDGCTLSSNNTNSPALTCNIAVLEAGATATYPVAGVQADDGDNSLIGTVDMDVEDPRPDNNSDLASAQVVAEFSEGPTQVISVTGTDIDAGDLNGDGEIDIAAAGAETRIYFNNGSRGLVTPGTSLGGATGSNAITLLDWNGDGQLDVAAGGLASGPAEIFVNDGSGGFASAREVVANIGAIRDIVDADLDMDGQSELVIAGSGGIVIARNSDQDGGALSSLSQAGGLGVAAADIDQDGDQDLVTIRANDRAVVIHYNDGTGTSFSQAELQAGSVATLAVADINSDGALDLLLGLDGSDLQAPQHQVFYQQGNGQFSAGASFGASPVSGLLSGDINDDGWPDVAAINEAGVHQVYLGSSAGGLNLAPEQLVSSGMKKGVLVDFNNDESLDLVLVGPEAGALEIHANNGIGSLGLGDRIAPNLQLLGETTVTLAAGVAYVDPGATAIDDIDGDITNLIETSGTINTTSVGTQTVTYRVSDRAGNSSSAVRTIKIGVNEGTGGSGGGALSLLWLLLGAFVAVRRRLFPGRGQRLA